jgi:hypothetical protein
VARSMGAAEAGADPVVSTHHHGARHFARHAVEMILAMMIGMAVLGALWRAILAIGGVETSTFRLDHPAVFALVMAFDMTLPMVLWMRHRGHNQARCAEMAGAMIIPTFLLVGLLQLGAISGDSLMGLEHALMLPAMFVVMLWRRDEYTRSHAPQANRGALSG